MTPITAVLALAGAVLIPAPRSGSDRLHGLPTAAVTGAATAAVRPSWLAVATVAGGAVGWAIGGALSLGALGALVGLGVGLAARRGAARSAGPTDDDPADLAAAWAQLAVCLEVGLPVAAAVGAAAAPLQGRAGAELRRVAGLLELGADPAQAWCAVENGSGQDGSGLAAFARAAARSAGTGAALARTARTEGSRIRAALADAAEARAQRAGVLITAPLGLCFLPAFLVLGIAPVVIGLAGEVLARW
jgi:pilus assembly protein TadC